MFLKKTGFNHLFSMWIIFRHKNVGANKILTKLIHGGRWPLLIETKFVFKTI